MHALLILISMGLVLVGGLAALRMLRRFPEGQHRRVVHLAVLGAPMMALMVGLGSLYHFSGLVCFIGLPPWDDLLASALPIGMATVSAGGVALALARLAAMRRFVGHGSLPAPTELQAEASRLAEGMGVGSVRVLVRRADQPLALTSGLRRSTVILSTWMLEHLDRSELRGVLAHEIAHGARRDYLVVWLATLLRDAFFYLPTSWLALRQLRSDNETECDDLAVGATGRPLALASALGKVWQGVSIRPSPSHIAPLDGGGDSVEHRIRRLLADRPGRQVEAAASKSAGRSALGAGTAGLISLLALQAMNLGLLLAPMGCSPVSTLGRLL